MYLYSAGLSEEMMLKSSSFMSRSDALAWWFSSTARSLYNIATSDLLDISSLQYRVNSKQWWCSRIKTASSFVAFETGNHFSCAKAPRLNLHCVSKTTRTLKRYSSKLYGSIFMIFCRNIPKKTFRMEFATKQTYIKTETCRLYSRACLLDISAKYHQNPSIQFRAISLESWVVFDSQCSSVDIHLDLKLWFSWGQDRSSRVYCKYYNSLTTTTITNKQSINQSIN